MFKTAVFTLTKRPKNTRFAMLWVLLWALLLNSVGVAQPLAPAPPFLHPLFSENAVLQRDRALTIWGWTGPGDAVTVNFDGRRQSARANKSGRWSVPLPAHRAGGPHALIVRGQRAGEVAARRNLMFGDVWLCSGQSNMTWPLRLANDGKIKGEAAVGSAVAGANEPEIRLLRVPNDAQYAPAPAFERASWRVCNAQSAADFSAVAYFFGRKLQRELKVPIGLIQSARFGVFAQSWASARALAPLENYDDQIAALERYRRDPSLLPTEWRQWWSHDVGTRANWQNPDFDDAAWKAVRVPGAWENAGYAGFDGAMWFRRTVQVPPAWAGRAVALHWDNVDDDDSTFWNGVPVGQTRGFGRARDYRVPGELVKAGRNSVAIRVLDWSGNGGLVGPQFSMSLAGEKQSVSLNGTWRMQPGSALSQMPLLPGEIDQNTATSLYNGMIAPLLPGQIKGVIWYQGESNVNQAARYRVLLTALIGDWRARFGEETGAPLPFYIVQLAGYEAPDSQPHDDRRPRLREAQALVVRDLPDTGLAVTIDIGEAANIHPANKRDVGLRLALQALKKTYGKNVRADGPTLQSVRAGTGKLVLSFAGAEGLTLRGDANRVFAIAGGDGKFAWARPVIEGQSIALSSDAVATPIHARFGWSNVPRAALYNGAGLPASPFRTDSYAATSDERSWIKRIAEKVRANPGKASKLGALALSLLAVAAIGLKKLRGRR